MLQKAQSTTAANPKGAFAHLQEVEITYSTPQPVFSQAVKSSQDAFEILKSLYDPRKINLKEFFYVLLLSRSNHILGYALNSIGSTAGTVVNIKEIFQLAILSNASSIILSHNHPSGNLRPSQADIQLTKKIKEGGRLFEISLLDHLIVTHKGYYSFADEGGI